MTPETHSSILSLRVSPRALLGFVLTVLALSWLQFAFVAAVASGRSLPTATEGAILLVGGFLSPLWALLAVGGMVLGRRGLGRLLRASLRPGAGAGVYLVAVLGPVAAVTVAALLVPGAGWPDAADEISAGILLAAAAGGLLANLVENLGWRAWLQQGLQRHMAPLVATLLVGVVWGLWHLPLFFVDGTPQADAGLSFVAYLPMLVALSVLFGALFNASYGSVLPVTCAHTAFNVSVLVAIAPASASQANAVLLVLTGVFAVSAAVVAWLGDMLRGEPAASRVPNV